MKSTYRRHRFKKLSDEKAICLDCDLIKEVSGKGEDHDYNTDRWIYTTPDGQVTTKTTKCQYSRRGLKLSA